MSSIVVAGDTSGTVTLQAPAVAGSTVLNLPTVTGGTLVTSDSSGIVSIGGTAQNTDGLQVMGTSASANLSEFRFSNNATGANIKLNKSRGTTVGAQGAVTNGDNLGTIYSYGSDGTSFIQSGSANFYCNGTVSTGIVPTSYAVSLMNSSGVINTQFAVTLDGTLYMNSGYGSVVPAYGCRAWVRFTGVTTVTVSGSGNVSSVTRNATGDYTVNFTTAMPDANFSAVISGSDDITNGWTSSRCWVENRAQTTSSVRINGVSAGGAAVDLACCNVAILR